MAFKKFEEDLKNNDIKNVCLLCGQEFFLVRWAVKALVSNYVKEGFADFDLAWLDGRRDILPSEILEACETLPVMSDKKIVVAEDLKDFESSFSRDEKDEKELFDCILNVPSSCVLVFVCREKADKRKKIYKKIAANGCVYEFDRLSETDITKWINKRFKFHKKQIDQRLVQKIIEDSGYFDKESLYNLFNLDNDIKKIVLHSDGERISEGDIDQSICSNVQRDVFLLIDVLSRQDKSQALKLLSNMMASGESIYGVLALLFRQYEHMLKISEMKDNHETMQKIRQRLGLSDFVINKLTGYAKKYGTKRLKTILHEVYMVDKSIKTGFLDARLSMELFIARV